MNIVYENVLTIGERVGAYDEFTLLPVGTVVNSRENRRATYTKQADGQWRDDRNQRGVNPVHEFALGYMEIQQWPDGYTPAPKPVQTVRQFRYAFRDIALSSMEVNGISRDVVSRALDELGCGAEEFPIGPGVVMESNWERGRLPIGSVVAFGMPNAYSTYGMFERVTTHRNWVRVFGGVTGFPSQYGSRARVESVPGVPDPPDWVAEVGGENSAREIAEFKRLAWIGGLKVKRQQQWCSTYESAVARAGITEDAMRIGTRVGAFTVGDMLNPQQVATCPVGSIFRWRSTEAPHTRVIWYRRTDNHSGVTNQAGTERIFGYQDDDVARLGNYAGRMELMAPPSDDLMLEVDIVQAFPHLPIGTVWRYEGSQYVICRDRQMHSGTQVQDRGQYALSAFTMADRIRIVSFGGDTS